MEQQIDFRLKRSNIRITDVAVHDHIKRKFDHMNSRDLNVDDIVEHFQGEFEEEILLRCSMRYKVYRILADAWKDGLYIISVTNELLDDYFFVDESIVIDAKAAMTTPPKVSLKTIPLLQRKLSDKIQICTKKTGFGCSYKFLVKIMDDYHSECYDTLGRHAVLYGAKDYIITEGHVIDHVKLALSFPCRVMLDKIPCLEKKLPKNAHIFVKKVGNKDHISVKILKKDKKACIPKKKTTLQTNKKEKKNIAPVKRTFVKKKSGKNCQVKEGNSSIMKKNKPKNNLPLKFLQQKKGKSSMPKREKPKNRLSLKFLQHRNVKSPMPKGEKRPDRMSRKFLQNTNVKSRIPKKEKPKTRLSLKFLQHKDMKLPIPKMEIVSNTSEKKRTRVKAVKRTNVMSQLNTQIQKSEMEERRVKAKNVQKLLKGKVSSAILGEKCEKLAAAISKMQITKGSVCTHQSHFNPFILDDGGKTRKIIHKKSNKNVEGFQKKE